jgi:hypothetical protein
MTGAQAVAKLERRLGLQGLVDERLDHPFLFDVLTESRDKLVRVFAQGCPIVVQKLTALEVQADDREYIIPSSELDPYKVLQVRAVTNDIPLVPGLTTDDAGEYMFTELRTLRLADGVTPPGGVEIVWVPSFADIGQDTTEAQIGLPTTCHMAMVKGAALEVYQTDEEMDTRNALVQFQMELQDLENLYSEYDALGGKGLRQAFLGAYGQWLGDMIY